MGKITLDTMQTNERAHRVSYRRSLENRPLETIPSGLSHGAFLENPSGREASYAAGVLETVGGRGAPVGS